MKVQTNPLGIGARGSIGSTTVSPRQTTGGANIRKATINYLTPSVPYNMSNEAIKTSDAIYKQLPDSVQSAWQSAADAMLLANVCGCPYGGIDGQKLFRWQNYDNIISGSTIDLSPPDTSGWFDFGTTQLERQNIESPTPTQRIFIDLADANEDLVISYKIGGGATVNIAVPGGSTFWNVESTDPGFAELWGLENSTQYVWCARTASGIPLTSGFARTYIAYIP